MDPTPSLPTRTPQDRRSWTRLANAHTDIRIASESMDQPACLIDQSFGGISVEVADVSELRPGNVVRVECGGHTMEAKVKRIEGGRHHSFRVAFEWLAQADTFSKILANLLPQ